MLVGEGPGQYEVREGKPFVGPSGQLLNQALRSVGVDRATTFITNATLCLPTGGADESVRLKAAECCKPRLEKELEAHPGPILALGAVASKALLGEKFSIMQMAGTLNFWNERPVVPTVHPAAILRGGDEGGAHSMDLLFLNLIYDIGKVDELAKGNAIIFTDDVQWEAEDPAKAVGLLDGFCNELKKGDIVAVDTETEVEKPHKATEPYWAEIRAISFATEKRAVSVRYDLLGPDGEGIVEWILGNPDLGKAFHNRVFDKPLLTRYGYYLDGQIHCTLLLHHAAFPGSPHDLQSVAAQFFLVTPWKAEFRAGEAHWDRLLPYNARDSLACARLVPRLLESVERTKTKRTYAIDRMMAAVAEEMTLTGIPIDRAVNAALADRFSKAMAVAKAAIDARAQDPEAYDRFLHYLALERATKVRKEIRTGKAKNIIKRVADPEDFTTRHQVRLAELRAERPEMKLAGDHVAAYLRAVGVTELQFHRTKTGKTKTSKDLLGDLNYVPAVKEIIDYRENHKSFSTFVQKIPERLDSRDRIHVVWSVNKITGRWGSEPNFQNVPKEQIEERDGQRIEKRPNLRKQVVAPQGCVLVGGDMAQLELRGIALLTSDPFLCGAFASGTDMHTEIAKELFDGGRWENFSKEEKKRWRDFTKRVEYGSAYLGTAEGIFSKVRADNPSVTVADVARAQRVIFEKVARLRPWHQELFAQVESTGELVEIISKRRTCFPLRRYEPSTVSNWCVQAGGASIVSLGLAELYTRLPETARIILQVHDAIVVECPEAEGPEVKELMEACMTQTFEYRGQTVTFPMDATIGKSWSEV